MVQVICGQLSKTSICTMVKRVPRRARSYGISQGAQAECLLWLFIVFRGITIIFFKSAVEQLIKSRRKKEFSHTIIRRYFSLRIICFSATPLYKIAGSNVRNFWRWRSTIIEDDTNIPGSRYRRNNVISDYDRIKRRTWSV